MRADHIRLKLSIQHSHPMQVPGCKVDPSLSLMNGGRDVRKRSCYARLVHGGVCRLEYDCMIVAMS